MRDDINSLIPALEPTRRGFIAGVGATGFALAVQPVSAQTVITTPATGLTADMVSIPAGDRDIPGYRAMPESGGPFPVVLVVQEIFGVHEHIQDVCRRLAKEGYFAVAPDLYVRQGDPSKIESSQDILRTIVSKVPTRQVMSDLDAAVAWAKSTGKADTEKLGITGFCWGGSMVWLYAAHNPGLDAAVAWYGHLSRPATEVAPRRPLDITDELKAPVLGLYGGQDQGIPLDSVEQMRAALKAADSAAAKASEIVVYPDAGHAFNADYRPTYRPEAARDGWRRMLEWFRAHGVA